MDFKEIKSTLYKIIDAINYMEEISKLPNCNTCNRVSCNYVPTLGERVRINCPLYIKK